MPRALLPAHEIEALLLEDVRQQRHCDKVECIRIRRCLPDDDNNRANWTVESVDCGPASREFVGSAVVVAMDRLQRDYDAIPWE